MSFKLIQVASLITTLLWVLAILDSKHLLRRRTSGAQVTARSSLSSLHRLVLHAGHFLIRFRQFSLENSIKSLCLAEGFPSLFTWMTASEQNAKFLHTESQNWIDQHMWSVRSIQIAKLFQEALLRRHHSKKLDEMKPSED